MANGLTRSARQSLLNHMFKVAVYTPATHLYVALFTVAPTSTGGGTECSGVYYARVVHDTWHTATAAEPSVITNDGVIVFPQSGGSWGTIVAFGIFDAATGGTLLSYGTCSQIVNAVETVRFADAVLSATMNET